MTARRDVVIVGGGHNALTAAAYLARDGRSVLLLEAADHLGGAAVSRRVFAGHEARLSEYSYLVSLLPQRIIHDLGLRIRLAERPYSSYTPDPADARTGLLLGGERDAADVVARYRRIGAEADGTQHPLFLEHCAVLTRALWPSMTDPLPTRSEARARVRASGDPRADAVWQALIEEPIGRIIERTLEHDLVRGLTLTDALIGTAGTAGDASLAQNRTFLYHLIGGGTGRWDVPVGGMGAVTAELARSAREAGADLRTGAEVTAIDPEGEVVYRSGDEEYRVAARLVLCGAAPRELERLLAAGGAVSSSRRRGHSDDAAEAAAEAPGAQSGSLGVDSAARFGTPRGAQLKVNLLLRRLPRLRDAAVTPEQAFAGTFHVNEGYTRLAAAHAEAAANRIPSPLPLEVYSHSLVDPSILGPELQAQGVQTMTVFGLQVPHELAAARRQDTGRFALTRMALASLDSVLAEPIEDLLLTDAEGGPCLEAKTTLDLEQELRMPAGDIFHNGLAWPFIEDDAPRETAAERWGVATGHARVLIAGAGARRGGGVSGLGGHAAAMAARELLGDL